MRYRKALQDMNKYPDATEEDLSREDTCIICREDMRPWDPTAVGAVERSRPKKLPCGHILHFGCLKGWLERQQVCPTCRRSVVIDGTNPDGIAAIPAPDAGGQPQPQPPAPGAPGGGAGGAPGLVNAGQPAQPRGNIRVFQLGPIRLGFAQGDAQNMQELANQVRQPREGVNQPIVPPALPTPTATAPPITLNNAQNSIENMQAQLHDISNRIQQEMYALQTTQAELQTLYALTVELNRLRQIQPQAIAGSGSPFIPPGLNSQFMAQQPHIHFPNTTMYMPPSPVTRHGGAPYASAIPSGSQDLPEGVSIPPGWSLLPLQRLDNQPPQQHLANFPTQATSTYDFPHQHQNPQAATQPTRNNLGHNLNSNMNPSIASTEAQPSVRNGNPQSGNDRNSAPSTSKTQTEPPNVAAPTPLIPQWGGSSQLFFNNRGGSSTSPSNTRNENPTDAQHDTGNSNGSDGEELANRSKGKAKAATVEDVAEDESD